MVMKWATVLYRQITDHTKLGEQRRKNEKGPEKSPEKSCADVFCLYNIVAFVSWCSMRDARVG